MNPKDAIHPRFKETVFFTSTEGFQRSKLDSDWFQPTSEDVVSFSFLGFSWKLRGQIYGHRESVWATFKWSTFNPFFARQIINRNQTKANQPNQTQTKSTHTLAIHYSLSHTVGSGWSNHSGKRRAVRHSWPWQWPRGASRRRGSRCNSPSHGSSLASPAGGTPNGKLHVSCRSVSLDLSMYGILIHQMLVYMHIYISKFVLYIIYMCVCAPGSNM